MVHTLQSERVCCRCVSWCQTNTCIMYAPAHALVPRTPVPKCTQHSLPKHAHIYIYIYTHIHTHTYAHKHACASTTLPHTSMPCYWDSQPIHKYTYTYTYICIYMHTYTYTYTHACIYINTCLYTHIHTHIYTHTYKMYVWTHARTPGTTTRQWTHARTPGTTMQQWLFARFLCTPGTTTRKWLLDFRREVQLAARKLRPFPCPLQSSFDGGSPSEASSQFVSFTRNNG